MGQPRSQARDNVTSGDLADRRRSGPSWPPRLSRVRAARGGAGWELVVVAGLATLGIACGIAAKAADESQARWIGDLGTYPAVWVLALAAIGRLAPTAGWAAGRAAAFVVTVCLGYYWWASFVLGFGTDRYPLLWLGLAVTVVPVIGACVRWACVRQGPFPGLVMATVAASAVVDGLAWQLWWAWALDAAPDGFPLRPVQAFVGIAVAAVVAGVLPRHARTRLWALALLVPVAIVADGVVDRAVGTLLRFV